MNLNTAPERRPQTLKERRAQLLRVADNLLYRMEFGEINSAERAQLIRSYEDIERTLAGMEKRIHEIEVATLLRWSDMMVDLEESGELEETE